MTSEQQWQEDVKQFGELAYLMWEKKEDVNDDYYVFASNLHVFDAIGIVDKNGFGSAFGSFHVRRKQSAALPFDLAAAEAGDGIQFMSILPIEWIDATFNSCDGENGIWITANNRDFYVDSSQLRMKHPRRVGVDYSQFEDKA